MPETSYGGPKPSGGLSFGLPDLGLGGSGGVAVPADVYGVPAAPVVASNGGSDGYGAPSNEGYGPSSAVSPFSQSSQSSNYGAPAAASAPASDYAPAAPAAPAAPSAPANDYASAEPALDSYGAPQADPISSGSSPVVSDDEYGAPAAPVITASAEPVSVVAAAPAVDDYSSPQAPIIQSAPAASVVSLKAEVPAADDYSSPQASVIQASVIQAAPADTYNEPSSYAAIPASEPIINDNSFDSYGSPRSPAPSSYDAPAVPAGNKRVIRRHWYHQLY